MVRVACILGTIRHFEIKLAPTHLYNWHNLKPGVQRFRLADVLGKVMRIISLKRQLSDFLKFKIFETCIMYTGNLH